MRAYGEPLNVVRDLWHQLFYGHVTPFRVLFGSLRFSSSTTQRSVSYGNRIVRRFWIETTEFVLRHDSCS